MSAGHAVIPLSVALNCSRRTRARATGTTGISALRRRATMAAPTSPVAPTTTACALWLIAFSPPAYRVHNDYSSFPCRPRPSNTLAAMPGRGRGTSSTDVPDTVRNQPDQLKSHRSRSGRRGWWRLTGFRNTRIASPRLLGRDRECAILDGLLAEIREGRSAVLLLRGEAGIGKTALLRYLIEAGSD